MTKYLGIAIALFSAVFFSACRNNEEVTPTMDSGFVTEYLTPTRVVLTKGPVSNHEFFLSPYSGQVSTDEPDVVSFAPGGSVLLDFGKEIQGGIQIVRSMSGDKAPARFRLCLGESVSEALSDVRKEGSTATNDHSVRDFEIAVPWLGAAEYGNSGFRFARLDYLGDDDEIDIVAVRAISKYRDIPYLGSFRCSDERLNQIWQTGAYTVHLNMQEYLWDGIKRDRLVWIGDMHPEVMTVGTVFGDQQVVRKSLDYVKEGTPATSWMNGICSYSLWWIIIQHHLYQWYGDLDYLKAQSDYLDKLLNNVISNLDGSKEAYREGRFIDWPSNDKPEVIHAGLQALSVRALEAGADMAVWLNDESLREKCSKAAAELRKYVPDNVGNSQAAALLAIEGMLDAEEASKIILANGPEKFTSFMGYYLLEALAKGGHYAEAMDLISKYWGRMIDLGATTFWEDFNYEDAKNAARIDEVVPEGKFDIHEDGGAWCYVGLRHSFCHGWASGPTTWLSRHVLGIEPVGIGFKEVRIEPRLGDLEWAEGSFPTPYGVIKVRHEKTADGTVASDIKLPKGIKQVK
ncbi:MAG: alpha-L-rhamnosidase [Bacteroidales bacterium]|nr:alpha-L-rhamnosidase [Bacteroidales bacterium]